MIQRGKETTGRGGRGRATGRGIAEKMFHARPFHSLQAWICRDSVRKACGQASTLVEWQGLIGNQEADDPEMTGRRRDAKG